MRYDRFNSSRGGHSDSHDYGEVLTVVHLSDLHLPLPASLSVDALRAAGLVAKRRIPSPEAKPRLSRADLRKLVRRLSDEHFGIYREPMTEQELRDAVLRTHYAPVREIDAAHAELPEDRRMRRGQRPRRC
jgi:hypothetical protein